MQVATLTWFASTLGLHENVVCIRSCIVRWKSCSRFQSREHVISHIIQYCIFCLHTSNIFFTIIPEKSCCFLWEKSSFYNKMLISGWRQLFTFGIHEQGNKISITFSRLFFSDRIFISIFYSYKRIWSSKCERLKCIPLNKLLSINYLQNLRYEPS